MSDASTRFSNDLRYRTGDHEAQRQLTPPYVLNAIRADMGAIGLDPCTEDDNPTKAGRFYTATDDGLTSAWAECDWTPAVYVNPPYSRAREPWVQRCIEAGWRGQTVVLLIPAATDTRIFQHALATANEVVFIRGRVKFGVLRANRRQEAASHPSALVGWNVEFARSAALGHRVVLSAATAAPALDGPVAADDCWPSHDR